LTGEEWAIGFDGKLMFIDMSERMCETACDHLYTIQQFTGYKTVDGETEIYEGDIVEHFGVVSFLFGTFGFPSDIDPKWFVLSDVDWRNLIVIGNIFEHPELINTTNNISSETTKEETEEVDDTVDLDFESCEQCGENAWDGRICHSCGMKII
jgi:hypothetical protein